VRTLVANFYREKVDEKISRYVELTGLYSEPVDVPGMALEPCYDMETFAAVVISGSQWMLASEDAPPATKEFIRGLRIPTLGICFGHQLLARSYGAEVLDGELIERNETVLVTEQHPLLQGLGPEFEMLESHREYVDYGSAERSGWHVFASSASCPVEAMHHPTYPLMGVQFHPERSGQNGEKLFENFYRNIVLPFQRTRESRGY